MQNLIWIYLLKYDIRTPYVYIKITCIWLKIGNQSKLNPGGLSIRQYLCVLYNVAWEKSQSESTQWLFGQIWVLESESFSLTPNLHVKNLISSSYFVFQLFYFIH